MINISSTVKGKVSDPFKIGGFKWNLVFSAPFTFHSKIMMDEMSRVVHFLIEFEKYFLLRFYLLQLAQSIEYKL